MFKEARNGPGFREIARKLRLPTETSRNTLRQNALECTNGRAVTLLAFLAFLPTGAPAQTTADHDRAPTIGAVPATGLIRIDGRLDDAAWVAALPVSDFTQRQPDEGKPASERTEVRVLYDATALYIGARLHDAGGPVSTRLGRRDSSLPGSDWFTIVIDSYHDHITAFRFSVNPSGVRRDEKQGSDEEDETWDPVWTASASTDTEGWSVELRIPLSQLRYREVDVQTWGVQLIRTLSRRNEESWFSFTPRRERSGIARFGHLNGLNQLQAGRRLELLPYLLSRAEYQSVPRNDEVGFANPFRGNHDYSTSAGLDLKYRLASNLTLDATINPDFGQVEVDPAVVNLTAFETRFDERRPFFIEGAEIFSFGSRDQLFYSRRIGTRPAGRVPSAAVYDDSPAQSTIRAAAKLTGKARGWSVGVLNALTAREHAQYVDEDGERFETEVAPLSNFLVGRARRELREGQTVIGGMTTMAARDLGDPELARRLRSSAFGGGVDFNHEWAERAWSLSGHVSGSHILGSREVLLTTQRSSARYYQRPDADYLAIDSSATTMTGVSARVMLAKESGEHWRGRALAASISPGFESNDLGFQSRADEFESWFDIEYVQEEPGRVLREWNLEVGPAATWNYGGDRLSTTLALEGSAELLNYWSGDFELRRSFRARDDRLTRGGPLAAKPAWTQFEFSIESDSRRAWTLNLGGDIERGAALDGVSANLEIGYKPAPNWHLSLSPQWSHGRGSAQYVSTITDPLATRTFGRRYVFAGLVEDEISLAAHVNVTFTPVLSLEVFTRPFISSGHFTDLKELRAPGTYSFDQYEQTGTVNRDDEELVIDPDGPGPARPFEVEDENFTVRSLRGNAVLRWEWRPGSTLFLVWQQQREAEERLGDLNLSRDFRGLGRIRPENVLLLKVSYWLNQ